MKRNQLSSRVSFHFAALLAVGVALALTGCAGPGIFFGPDADPQSVAANGDLKYPKGAPAGEHLDIVAFKEGNQLTLTNRTTRAFTNVQLWINQQYVGIVDTIPVGERKTLMLNQFINEHGEAFPVGGLFNPERSYRLVLAEIFETGGRRYRILVRTDEVTPGM